MEQHQITTCISSNNNLEYLRKKVVEMYTYQNVCMYWYNFFANLNGVDSE